jgi:hypothetical protein
MMVPLPSYSGYLLEKALAPDSFLGWSAHTGNEAISGAGVGAAAGVNPVEPEELMACQEVPAEGCDGAGKPCVP